MRIRGNKKKRHSGKVCNKTTDFKSYDESRNEEKSFQYRGKSARCKKGSIEHVKVYDPDLKIDGYMLVAKANYF